MLRLLVILTVIQGDKEQGDDRRVYTFTESYILPSSFLPSLVEGSIC